MTVGSPVDSRTASSNSTPPDDLAKTSLRTLSWPMTMCNSFDEAFFNCSLTMAEMEGQVEETNGGKREGQGRG